MIILVSHIIYFLKKTEIIIMYISAWTSSFMIIYWMLILFVMED